MNQFLSISFEFLISRLLIFVAPSYTEVYHCYECAGDVDDCVSMEACEQSCIRHQKKKECSIQNFECSTVAFSFLNTTTGRQQFAYERSCAPNHSDDCWKDILCMTAVHFNSTDCEVCMNFFLTALKNFLRVLNKPASNIGFLQLCGNFQLPI